ncbi:MAG TPA: RluA family pseudouridine synthase, partial [Terrimesophilobacter sp.]|nr:RluA family pseudouridine synthase [Terrimesophilobacter sp.]
MESRSLPVPEGLVGERVDTAVAKLLGFSRSFAAEVIDAGGVALDGRVCSKSDRVASGSWLEVQWQPKHAPTVVPVAIDSLGIIFEDGDIVVIDKPVGVAAHPTIGWDGPTVLGGLAAAGVMVSTSGAAERQGIVHRLDAGTSGVMVVAKSERAYTELKRAFHDRDVDKVYHAVVEGRLDPLEGTIDAPIGRHP